jgi:hypothetical protein
MVAIAMATPKAKKKTAKKTKALPSRKAAKKIRALAARKAAKKSKALPPRKAAKKGKALPPQKAASKAKAAPAPSRKSPKKRAAPKPAAPKPAAMKPSAAARKAAAQKAPAKPIAKPATKPSVARARPLQRRDNAGHLDPKYAADLLAMSEPREEDPRAFLERPRSSDDLVEELGEEFVQEVTSGEYKAEDSFNAEVPEEVGGPFVETTATTEFAPGTDPSNPDTATREPFPST